MRIIDPHHWMDEHGNIPTDNPRIRRQMVRVAQFIEYGGPLVRGEFLETLIECRRRPGGQHCLGFMWINKTDDDSIFAYCFVCKTDEALVHSWQDTDWADGPMEPVAHDLLADPAGGGDRDRGADRQSPLPN